MVVPRNSYPSAHSSQFFSTRRSTFGLLLLLLLVHVAPFSTAWKFRWGRGGRNNSEAAGISSGSSHEKNGRPTAQSHQPHAAHHPQPGPSDPLSEERGRKPFFSWDVASAAAEIAEDTMEEAVDLFHEVVDRLKPPPALQHALVQAFAKFKAALLYQPPVGFVTTFVVSRLLLTGRIFRLKAVKDSSVEDELFDSTKKEQTRGRSLILDGDDNSYTAYGGIEHIRRRLCLAAVNGLLLQQQQYLQHIHQQHEQQEGETNAGSAGTPPQTPPLTESQQQNVEAAVQALSVTFQPTGSRRRLVHEMIDPVSKLEAGVLLATTENDAGAVRTKGGGTTTKQGLRAGTPTPGIVDDPCSIPPHQVDQLLQVAALTSQVQAMDALLRLCRDRILQTTYRLARTVEHWERRVQQSRYFGRWVQWLVQQSIEGDRLQLSLAVAAYNAEVTRLGQVTAVLMERPSELPEQAMIEALKATEERSFCPQASVMAPTTIAPASVTKKKDKVYVPRRPKEFLSRWRTRPSTAPISGKEDKVTVLQRPKEWLSRWKSWPLWSKYSFRWKADSKGILSIRRFDASDSYIDVPSAVNSLLKNYTTTTNDYSEEDWMSQARDWAATARGVVCQAVQGCLQGSTHKSLTKSCSEADFRMLRDQWCTVGAPKTASSSSSSPDVPAHPDAGAVGSQWRSLVQYVDQTPSWRRIGEGQKIRLRDAFRFVDWYKNWDFFGIPSSLLMIYGSTIVHERFVKVYWSTVSKEFVDIAVKAGEIFKTRAWGPMKEIYDDIMNKSPSMMSALGLDVEETSLDHMLRDLGFGDGTAATRPEALKRATEQYEKDLSSGLFTNFLKGRLVRLMLVQVQQLKVGLLSALDTIDVLIQGNRIHFKVLAAIPAVVIATFGTRYLARVLYNLRSKDIRPVTVVHAEMGQYLTKIENLLLLSEQVDLSEETFDVTQTRQRPEKQTNHSGSGHWATELQPAELGELILNMHRYLILLDFSSPPFPSRNCDQIHSSLQQFLGTGGTLKRLDSDRQILWLGRIKQKHQDLVKTI